MVTSQSDGPLLGTLDTGMKAKGSMIPRSDRHTHCALPVPLALTFRGRACGDFRCAEAFTGFLEAIGGARAR